MHKVVTCFCLGIVITLFAGCGERKQVADSEYAVIHPESWNPDGHPGTFLYYKGKPLWFNVGCSDYGYHDGVLVFEGDVPDSAFKGESSGQDFAASWQMFAIRGSGPPVMISERILQQPLKRWLFDVKSVSQATNGLTISFGSGSSSIPPTNVTVTWPEIKMWLDEAETNAPVRNSRMGKYRYLSLKQP